MIATPRLPRLADPRQKMPVVDLKTAAGLCDEMRPVDLLCDVGDAIGSHDPRRIPWAWNIGGEGAEKVLLRILTKGVVPEDRPVAAQFTLDQVLLEIFPRAKGQHLPLLTLPSSYIAWRLACTTHHVNDLVDEGLLTATEKSRGKKGRTSSPEVTWDSIRKFLEARKL